MRDGGAFGVWATDPGGLPCFELDNDLSSVPGLVLPGGGCGALWHQVGNDRITATAHAGGSITLYSAECGFVRLNDALRNRNAAPAVSWSLLDDEGGVLATSRGGSSNNRVRWGVGYAQWESEGAWGKMVRTVSAPFGELPLLRIDIEFSGDLPPGSDYVETWSFRPHPLLFGPLVSRLQRAPSTHSPGGKAAWYAMFGATSLIRAATEAARRALGSLMALEPSFDVESRFILLTPKRLNAEDASRQSFVPRIGGVVFVAALNEGSLLEACRQGPVTRLGLGACLEEPGSTVSFVVGVCPRGEVAGAVDSARGEPAVSSSEWKGLFALDAGGHEDLEREATWSAGLLKGSRVRDRHFGLSYVPQGSAYGYVMGMQGAPRDYHGPCVPLTYIDPEGARDMLRLTMRMTRPDGVMYYCHTGAGACTSAVIHTEPTDLPLFLLWALCEHVFATGDFPFLDEEVDFHPGRGRAGAGTVRDRVLLAFSYIRDTVGLGEHGMMRCGSGDWSDPISFMVADERAFRSRGESGFNTAMAVHVLPLAASLLEDRYPSEAREMRAFAHALRAAMEEAWTGSHYLRGWDGRGVPLGLHHLFLDSNLICLLTGVGGEERCRELLGNVKRLCIDPSPIGATILDRPHRVRLGVLPDGWDCNGGVWAALNGMLAWAVSLYDAELAWRCLAKQTLAAHARAYPSVWYGIWSGPDAYNAHYGDRPGETFIHPATPMNEFPVMNSHAHAGPLLALLKVLGIEAGPAGLEIRRRPPESVGAWKLSTTLADFTWDGRSATIEKKWPDPAR